MGRQYCALLLLAFLAAAPLLLLDLSETVRWKTPVLRNSNFTTSRSLEHNEHEERHNSTTNESVGPQSTSQKKKKPVHHHKRKRHHRKKGKQRYDKYIPNVSAAKKKFLADQASVKSVPTEAPGWVFNKTAADLFREKIANGSRVVDGNFWVTQQNAPLNTALHAYLAELKVSTSVFNRLPKENPFNARRFNTCSIVGNGGILKGSGCGKEIDASEFVFRCNLAPMDSAYRKDIGEKTSLVTMNPSMLTYRYHAFAKGSKWFEKSKKDRKAFIKDLSVYGDSFIWIGAFFTRTYELVFKTQDVLLEGKAKQKVVIAHPDFVRSVHSFWKENGLKAGRASTGIILVSAASQMCEEVHLYGFWPFHSDRKSRRLTEHYYDNALSTKYHSIPDEFKQLQRLHNTGVLRLTTTACQSEINADN